MVDRGLSGLQLIIPDACQELVESVAEYLPDMPWLCCIIRFYRNVFDQLPSSKAREFSHRLEGAIRAQESRAAAQEKVEAVIAELRHQRLMRAAELVELRRRDIDLLRLPGHPLAEDPDQQPAGAATSTSRYRKPIYFLLGLNEVVQR